MNRSPSTAEASRFEGLHVLVDDDPRWTWDPLEQTRAACEGGASVVQLRAKFLNDRETVELGKSIRELTRNAGIQFVVNDRFDLALACKADAVHLGQTDFPPQAIPQSIRRQLGVGRSTHTVDQAHIAIEERADYIALGPIFGTQSKESEYEQRGLSQLREVVKAVAPRPVVAIGGITSDNLTPVLETGARGAAVISAVAQAEKPQHVVRELARVFHSFSERA
ncbi:MAG: thiamine phosphate synthase [Myxococcota bacterium]|nr:thiamine phosphate synthase [Myxococcota bacterium]